MVWARKFDEAVGYALKIGPPVCFASASRYSVGIRTLLVFAPRLGRARQHARAKCLRMKIKIHVASVPKQRRIRLAEVRDILARRLVATFHPTQKSLERP